MDSRLSPDARPRSDKGGTPRGRHRPLLAHTLAPLGNVRLAALVGTDNGGMLASDFIGFHTPIYRNNFLTCAKMSENRVDRERPLVSTDTGKTKVSPVPLG